MRDALHGVVHGQRRLRGALFEELGHPHAAGKTGTGETAEDQDDTAWFACYAPYDDPKYVVACVVEQGGGGSAVRRRRWWPRCMAAALDAIAPPARPR